MNLLCECNSFSCSRSVEVSLAEAQAVLASGLIVILKSCPNGPETGDVLVEERSTYSLYMSSI